MDISELRKGPHLSASAINDYLDCGLLYKLSRIDKLKSDLQSDALEFGKTIHRVLADFYRVKMLGDTPDPDDMEFVFEEYWKETAEGNPKIQYRPGKDFQTYLVEGKKLLKEYSRIAVESPFQVLAIEEPFRFDLEELPVPIVGILDLVVEDESGAIIITDWKTSSKAYANGQIDQNLQLTIYNMALKATGFDDREILLRFDCLIKSKNPRVEQYYTARTEKDQHRALKKIIRVWEAIERGVFIPNDQSWKCKGCGYKAHCDEWFDT